MLVLMGGGGRGGWRVNWPRNGELRKATRRRGPFDLNLFKQARLRVPMYTPICVANQMRSRKRGPAGADVLQLSAGVRRDSVYAALVSGDGLD